MGVRGVGRYILWGQVMSFCDRGNGCLVRGIIGLSEDRLVSQDGLFYMHLLVKSSYLMT
jgi:hypothetical protein